MEISANGHVSARLPLLPQTPSTNGKARPVGWDSYGAAPTSDPASVTKDPANPIFRGTGQAWDSCGVREAEIFKGPQYFHILYGGSDGKVWRIGHALYRYGTGHASLKKHGAKE